MKTESSWRLFNFLRTLMIFFLVIQPKLYLTWVVLFVVFDSLFCIFQQKLSKKAIIIPVLFSLFPKKIKNKVYNYLKK